MLRFASFRCLAPSLSLLCLLTLSPACRAQDVRLPTPAVQKLADQGKDTDKAGKHEEALRLFNDALTLARESKDKAGESLALRRIGNVYWDMAQKPKALEYYNQALPIARAVGDKREESAAIHNIGNFYNNMGQPQKALEYYQQALALYRQTGDTIWEAYTLTSINVSYKALGQPQKGLEILQQAVTLYRQAGNKDGEASMLIAIGGNYADTDQPQKALENLQPALQLYKRLGNKSGEAGALGSIGWVYYRINQRQKALEFMEQALTLFRQLGDKNGEIGTLGSLAVIYENTGQPQKALEVFEPILLLHRQTGDKSGEAWALANIGVIHKGTAQPQKALAFLEPALLLFRKIGDRSGEACVLRDMGSVYTVLGQHQKAIEYQAQALPLFRQLGDKVGEIGTLNNLAFGEQQLSRPEQALNYDQQAVVVMEQLRGNVGSQGEARSLFLASNMYIYYHYLNLLRQSGKVEEAFALTQKMKARSLLDLLASSRVDLNAALTAEERQQLNTLQLQGQQLNAQMLKEGVENEVGAKKRFAALQEQLKQNESQLQTLTDKLYALHPGLADQQQAHTATVEDIAPLLPADTALLEYVQTSDKELLLFVVSRQAGKPQVSVYPIAVEGTSLSQQCADFHDACADPRKDPAALSASLSRLLLSPAQKELQGKKRLIVCPDGALWDVPFVALRAPTGNDNRNTDASLWQRYELSYAYSATGMQAAASAHTRHKPAEHASVLALANPDFGSSSRFGDLDDVPGQRPFELPSRPFELPSRPFELPSRPFELPSRPVELPSRPFELPSRPVELPSRPVELPSRQLTAALQAERGEAIKSLPGAQQEAEAIHKLFKDAAIYTGKAAQEHVVTEEASKYKYLHFATHGFFNDAAPLLSCIVLAQPQQLLHKAGKGNEAGENKAVTLVNVVPKPEDAQVDVNVEDGLLTARKVFGLHLNADLVTLSACNSGRGQVRTGEGIVGLTWAFFAAGCPSQVVSQWSVDDAATGQLMADFYKGLKQGKSKAAALRNAALKLSKDGKHQHPYYWTPFFLVGDWK